MKVDILTYEVNEYDQCGEYFLAAFNHPVNPKALKDYLISDHFSEVGAIQMVDHLITKGGGRQGVEYEWYNLRTEELL